MSSDGWKYKVLCKEHEEREVRLSSGEGLTTCVKREIHAGLGPSARAKA